MSTSIDQSFVKQYEADVHTAYQRMGSRLRNTVRTRPHVIGATCVWQKVGKGSASTKSRHGQVPVMNASHSPVEATLVDYYAGDWVDKLDQIKLNIDERQVVVNAGAYALGRKSDELITTELDTSANFAGGNVDGLTIEKSLLAIELLNNADVPDDGQRYAVVGNKQWNEMLLIDEFSNADFVGFDELPFKGGMEAKRWLGVMWMRFSGLTLTSGVRFCHMYHKTAVGHAIGQDVASDITWHGDRASWFVNNMMSQAAKMIDVAGVATLRCKE
jgi:hypothetical protein